MKKDEEFPQNRLRKRYGSISTRFFFMKTCFLPKTAKMHRQGVRNEIYIGPLPLFIAKMWRCLPPRDIMKKISKRTPITKFTPLFILYGKVTEALRKCLGFDFHLFFSSFPPILSQIYLPKVFRNFTKALRKPRKPWKPFFNNVEELTVQLLPP